MLDGISPQLLFGQLLLGLINGSFYAMLSMGLAIIFGLMNVVNFAHGMQYMLGAFIAWLALTELGVPYWGALVVAPVAVGLFGMAIERLLLRPLQSLDHLYASRSWSASAHGTRSSTPGSAHTCARRTNGLTWSRRSASTSRG
jgi:branched-chain amino acid transport system permease protein